MKIALVCQSLLLARALKSFLTESIVPYKQCDFVISDKKIELDKPIFYLAHNDEGDLPIPFSKSSLQIELENFFRKMTQEPQADLVEPTDSLEDKIALLTEKFRQELIQTLRDYYGN